MRSFTSPSWLALIVIAALAAGAAAAGGYALTAPKRYRATADLLVSPESISAASARIVSCTWQKQRVWLPSP